LAVSLLRRLVPAAVAAVAGFWCAEGAVAAVAVLEGDGAGLGGGCRGGGERRGKKLGQPVREQRGRTSQVGGEAGGQGAAYGVGARAAFQPGGHGRGEAVYVALREQQSVVVAAQVREQCGGDAGRLGRGTGFLAGLRLGLRDGRCGIGSGRGRGR
jgi:hypothetical protein